MWLLQGPVHHEAADYVESGASGDRVSAAVLPPPGQRSTPRVQGPRGRGVGPRETDRG